jgi:uncharacterized protein YbjT (DUF2867 family)
MNTLVVGATGLVGSDVCARLREAGHHVRALVRRTSDPAKRQALENQGVELVYGDLKDPTSLAPACAGIDAVISTASSTLSRQPGDGIESVDDQGQLALVRTAREAGVSHFVFVSFRNNPSIQYPLTRAKRAVERALIESGMNYTILQASYFMEVWLSPALGFDVANRKVRLFGQGTAPVSYVSYRDVAHAAAFVVDQPLARNAVIEFGGPDALSQRDVIQMIEVAGGGPMATERVSEAELETQRRAATDSMQQSFCGLMLQCAQGDAMDPSRSREVLPFARTSVREYIAAQVAPTG